MASPKILAFFLFNPTTGAPVTGQTPVFETYKDDLGVNLAAPTITEVGGGAYKFTPVFTVGRGIAFCIDSGVSVTPRRTSGFLRPEDFNIDNGDVASSTLATSAALAAVSALLTTASGNIDIIRKIETNKWAIFTTGPDANHLIIYDDDGTTTLYRFLLTDSTGIPTTQNPFRRIPDP